MSQPSSNNLPLCHLISTGGTIAMKIDPVANAAVPALSGNDLIASVPGISNVFRIEVNNLSNVPSDYMTPQLWVDLKKEVDAAMSRPEVAGIIVSHGTDTLEETAWFLDLTINREKPLILIGAQRNASFHDFDGPRNLLNAARLCVHPGVEKLGAVIAMNNQINAAREATKTHTADVEAFKSGDFGVLGVIDVDRIVLSRQSVRRQYIELKENPLPRVEIIPMFGGANGGLLRAAVNLGAKGIVIQALGLGNVNEAMYEAIKDAISNDIPVVISTRVPNGRVMPAYAFVGGGQTLAKAGAVFADNLSPQKARILLMLALQTTTQSENIQKIFDR